MCFFKSKIVRIEYEISLKRKEAQTCLYSAIKIDMGHTISDT